MRKWQKEGIEKERIMKEEKEERTKRKEKTRIEITED